MAYVKAPKYRGKDLTVQVGRGDLRILDGVKYTDSRLARYVGLGMLVEVSDSDKAPTVATTKAESPKATPAPATPAVVPAAPPQQPPPSLEQQQSSGQDPDGGTTTKSPAPKVSAASGKKAGGVKGKSIKGKGKGEDASKS